VDARMGKGLRAQRSQNFGLEPPLPARSDVRC